MYTMVPALALLIIYALHRAIEGEGGHWWVVQSVATTLAFYSHILAALLIPVQILLYFVWWPRARKQWVGALVSLAFLILPYLPLVLWQAPQVLKVREDARLLIREIKARIPSDTTFAPPPAGGGGGDRISPTPPAAPLTPRPLPQGEREHGTMCYWYMKLDRPEPTPKQVARRGALLDGFLRDGVLRAVVADLAQEEIQRTRATLLHV